jgi:hypothetical protein
MLQGEANMKRIAKQVLTMGGAFFLVGSVCATVPNANHPTTFLGPTLRAGFANDINDMSAFSVTAEFGDKNERLSGAVGWLIMSNQRFKISADYLRQDITNAFFDGNTDQWIQQGTVSAEYGYDFLDCGYHPSLSINGFLSRAPTKNLRVDSSRFVNSSGLLQKFTDAKRLAGSNAGGLSPGATMTPWQGARLGADINYDIVRYDTKYGKSHDATGFGGTVRVNQAIAANVDLDLLAAVRQPFNNYQAGLYWRNLSYCGSWTLGLNYEYSLGKNTLPSTYNVSFNVDYSIDQPGSNYRLHTDGIDNFMNTTDQIELNGVSSISQQAEKHDFLAWTSKEAEYLPQVLTVPEEKVTLD